MAAYTGIQGQNILIVSSDPSNPTEGQIWYNSTTNLLKGYQFAAVNAWASGGNTSTGRRASPGGAGTQTAALIFGGFIPPNTAATEAYNGSSWTSGGNLNTSRRNLAGVGLQTAALAIGGTPGTGTTGATELYNGSAWTSNPTGLNTSREGLGTSGTQTAALAFGGYFYTNVTESWNGSNWTSLPATLPVSASDGMGVGTQTAALYVGCAQNTGPGGPRDVVQSWNGSIWTTAASLNTGRTDAGATGTQTAAIAFGGNVPPQTTVTELYNGTSWTNSTSMATARDAGAPASAGTQTAALYACGDSGPGTGLTTTEEWTGSLLAVKTITTS